MTGLIADRSTLPSDVGNSSRIRSAAAHSERRAAIPRLCAAGAALFLAALFAGACVVSGCQSSPRVVTRPSRHSIRSDQLLVLSDFRLAKDHPLIQDLITLRHQVAETLNLPLDREEVVVYLFTTEQDYQQYLEGAYPGLPHRRAYFVGTPRELAVYTFWGDRIQEDLRHEYTHGLLHASLKNVPLWIDEGLAEYFEVSGPWPGTVNVDYAQRLAASLANGWRPDMKRLERLDEFAQMQRIDYQEAWSWAHYMLHSTPEAKQALLSYLADLQTTAHPRPLSDRLEEVDPHVASRFLAYLTSLNTAHLLSEPPGDGSQTTRLTSESRAEWPPPTKHGDATE